MITGYDLQKNTYSDQKFAEEAIKRSDKDATLLVDGAYYSEDIDKKAKDKGIKILPTNIDRKRCSNCPLGKDCPVIKQKKSYLFKVLGIKLHRCQLITKIGTSKY